MLDSAARFFIDGGSVRGGFVKQKSNGANVNIIRADVAGCFINGEQGLIGVLVPTSTDVVSAGLVGFSPPHQAVC